MHDPFLNPNAFPTNGFSDNNQTAKKAAMRFPLAAGCQIKRGRIFVTIQQEIKNPC